MNVTSPHAPVLQASAWFRHQTNHRLRSLAPQPTLHEVINKYESLTQLGQSRTGADPEPLSGNPLFDQGGQSFRPGGEIGQSVSHLLRDDGHFD